MNAPSFPAGLTDFSGKTVLITGSTGGLGRALAVSFHTAGARVALHYHRHEEEARKLAFTLNQKGGEAVPLGGDLTDPQDVELLIDALVARFGTLDVLINNAGDRSEFPVERISGEEWDRILSINLKGVHLLTRGVIPVMKRGGGGSIVNIASIEGDHPGSDHAHYAASKGGVIAYTKACARELGGAGIRVNAVSPGLISRPGIDTQWPDGVRRWEEVSSLGRLVSPEEVGYAALFLASGWASAVTGINLVVDCGYSIS